MGILLVYDVTDDRSFNSTPCFFFFIGLPVNLTPTLDIRTWHANIEQHASEGVNKILIGNKSDWTDKRAVSEEQGRELAQELGIKFIETSAKINEGVEEAFFTLARYVFTPSFLQVFFSYIYWCSAISRPASSIRKLMLPAQLLPQRQTRSGLISQPPRCKPRAVAHRYHLPPQAYLHSLPVF
jgi:Ras family